MDPLSIAASLAGLITISTQIVNILHTIKSKNKKELDSLSKEVHTVRGILSQIQQIVQFQSTKAAKNSEWLSALNTTLDDCGDTYLQLQKFLQGLVSNSRLEALKKNVKWTLKEKDIQDSLRKVESYKLSLDLLLSIQTSTTTTNIEDVLVQLQKKLLPNSTTASPTTRTPLSWRKKLAGFEVDPLPLQTSNFEDTQSDAGNSRADVSYIIPGSNTINWTDPGIFGINRDEGKDAPDLNSPGLVCICEISVGQKKISLFCSWETHPANEMFTPIRAHILFKGPAPGDLYFIQLEESSMTQPVERFVVPVGKCSLIIALCNIKGCVYPLSELDKCDDNGQFNLALEDFALNSNTGSQQVLVNFDNFQDREKFLDHLYGIRYLQRMDSAFVISTQFYHHSPYQKRIQNVQIGYADGTEKSYIYPYLYLDYPIEGQSLMLVCGTKPNNEKAVVFKENILELDIQIVGSEALVFTNQDGKAIHTISATLGSLDELLHLYHRLQDVTREWKSIEAKGVDNFETKAEWLVDNLEFLKDSLATTSSFNNVLVAVKADRFSKRMKMEISRKDSQERLASCHVLTSSILFYKEHFRKDSPDFFTDPVMQTSFWDLTQGSATPDNFQVGQVKIHGANAGKICDELEEIVESLKADTEEAQKKFLKTL
ncbi:uncharacterized protein N7479_005221 [Penicillium vulpinum]|uniref:Azaphilone pigments biosynthesis cluster protein L N-terminal domain-containing protein n=1 Tax=Penicillium vulpinum TaxID=29845 RepID=A0A1V6RG03_9EURO|nr:uncharacterized protein N7479_005221 [Penicillium vulpinum]KAJ5958071.1 hypothetical protein N7479_005221 [Penicillium vulpinum]OQE00333.1 hypothetical protein PENVUL_c054G00236 [Penicillium vulpinum]